MARKVEVTLVDDIDGSAAERTVSFGFDGVGYEIDLSTANIVEFGGAIDEFVEHARKVTPTMRRTAPSKTGTGPAVVDPIQSKAIRKWATENGYTVAPRGRISADVIADYHARAGRGTASAVG